jgi:positive phototaxis protein PixI
MNTTITEQQEIQLIQFQLADGSSAAIEINRIVEILNVPIDRIVPIPDMPSAVLGVYNWRGEMLWIADLSRLLAIPSGRSKTSAHYPVLVIGSGSQNRLERSNIGTIVAEVSEIESYPLEAISSPQIDSSSSRIAEFALGSIPTINGDLTTILDPQLILDRSHLDSDI